MTLAVVVWGAWALVVLSLVAQIVANLVGPPERVPWPWLTVAGAAVLLAAYTGVIMTFLALGLGVAVWPYAGVLVLLVVSLLLTRRRHVRASQAIAAGGSDA
ncbi:hypothetical protein [Jannaschia sp. R86511]|uniref:hypothetical protein n=1 Tax=Jannaschia sp. R86511 TaxID=3093853 RepID=UPI0036D21383